MIRQTVVPFLGALILITAPTGSFAQIAPGDAPVVYGHHHVNATDIDEHKKFYVDALGGIATNSGPTQVVKFPNVVIFFSAKAPTDGSKGSTADHLGLQVPDLRATINKLRAAGYPIVTKEEMPAGIKAEIKDGIATILPANLAIAFVMGPEGAKIELVENKAQTAPSALHHIHFASHQATEMKAWYDKVFGAKIPGVSLMFTQTPNPVAGTQGRVVDHIGFEIPKLADFLKEVEAKGIKVDLGYTPIKGRPLAIAFITDPWDTRIELTEGLPQIP
jgi:catechol 2,3-dioxygenase-like lactoylglutathione lyase family enzyme